ncbi:MAG: Hsp20/alpha crystallin family protein [Anaerolineae bacterium]|nr:Hsp20/alpha crystallin family protein [Anaerolineae bacterium]
MLMRYDRFNPFREMRRMMDLVERELWPFEDEAAVNPLALDVSSDDKHVIVRTAIPGVKQEDINIEVRDDILTISAESRAEYDEQKENWHRRELRYGKFSRAVRLPEDVNFEKAEAELENGILTIKLPKTEPSPVKKIAVKAKKLLEAKTEKK